MKKRTFLLVLIILAICVQSFFCVADEQQTPLKVYYVGGSRLFREALAAYQRANPTVALDITTFSSDDEMQSRLSVEMLSGEGPDVILLGTANSFDFQKLAMNNAFCDLSVYYEADEGFNEDQYFSALLDAGKLNGAIYAVPFNFNLPHLITSQEKLAEIGVADIADMSFEEILTMLVSRSKELTGQDEAIMSVMTRRTDVGYYLYETTLGSLYGSDGEVRKIDETAQREISEFIRTFYDGLPQLQAITKRYRNDFVNAVARIDFLMEDYQLPVNMRYYDAYYNMGLGETLVFIPLPSFYSSGAYHAQVNEYGVAAAQTKQAEKCYELLRFIQDYQTEDGIFIRANTQDALDIPVRKDAAESALNAAMSKTGGYAMLSGKRSTIPALQSDFGLQITQWYDQIVDAYIPNRKIGAIIAESMDAYYLGTADYDSCNALLTNALWIYMSE